LNAAVILHKKVLVKPSNFFDGFLTVTFTWILPGAQFPFTHFGLTIHTIYPCLFGGNITIFGFSGS